MTDKEERIKEARALVQALTKEKAKKPSPSPCEADAFHKAKARAVAFLGLDHAKSPMSVRRVLKREGYACEIIEQVLASLYTMDYLNDLRAGAKILRRHQGRKFKGDLYYERAFREQGLDRKVFDTLLRSLPSESERLEVILEGLSLDANEQRRTIRRLASRGFRQDSIRQVWQKWKEEA